MRKNSDIRLPTITPTALYRTPIPHEGKICQDGFYVRKIVAFAVVERRSGAEKIVSLHTREPDAERDAKGLLASPRGRTEDAGG